MGPLQVALQHFVVPEVVEHHGRATLELQQPLISALGQIEPAQAIIGGRKAEPSLRAIRVGLDGSAKVALRQPIVTCCVMQLPERHWLVLRSFIGGRRYTQRQLRSNVFDARARRNKKWDEKANRQANFANCSHRTFLCGWTTIRKRT